MMTLREYRKRKKLTLDEMAPSLGVTTASLSRIETGLQWPDREFFERLEVATGGAVTANDFVSVAHRHEASDKQT